MNLLPTLVFRFSLFAASFANTFIVQPAHTDVSPAQAAARQAVDGLIKAAPGNRATLGRLNAAMETSINFGAPTWNAGDHAACCHFYVKTGQSLCDAFDAPAGATDPARIILADLHGALDRVSKCTDVDANAWTMRYVFEKTAVAIDLQITRCQQMNALGQQNATRSSFVDAADAFTDATAALHELRGVPLEELPDSCRSTPLALSDALFALQEFPEAAASVEDGLIYLPDLAESKLDLHQHFSDPAAYQALLGALRTAIEQKPTDASLQLLYGYHLFFTGQRDDARPYLQKAQKLDPNLTAPGKLLSAPAP